MRIKFLDVSQVLIGYSQVLKKNRYYGEELIRNAIVKLGKMANGLDMLGSYSKGYFYHEFTKFIRNQFDGNPVSDWICHDFGYWLFIKMKDFANITFHIWRMTITVDGEFGPRKVIVLDNNIDLISDTSFFEKSFFDNEVTCNLELAISTFASVDNKGRDLCSTMYALYDAIELYGPFKTVKFEHEEYTFP